MLNDLFFIFIFLAYWMTYGYIIIKFLCDCIFLSFSCFWILVNNLYGSYVKTEDIDDKMLFCIEYHSIINCNHKEQKGIYIYYNYLTCLISNKKCPNALLLSPHTLHVHIFFGTIITIKILITLSLLHIFIIFTEHYNPCSYYNKLHVQPWSYTRENPDKVFCIIITVWIARLNVFMWK